MSTIQPLYLPWIEDLKIGEVGFVLLSTIRVERTVHGGLVYFIAKQIPCFPYPAEEFCHAVKRTGQDTWELDFSKNYRTSASTLFTPFPEGSMQRNLYYGPFEFAVEPKVYDQNDVDARYQLLLVEYQRTLSIADMNAHKKIMHQLCETIEEYLRSSRKITDISLKYDFLMDWREVDVEIAEFIDPLLIPHIQEHAKGDLRFNMSFLDELEEAREERFWDVFIEAIPDESLLKFAEYDIVDMKRELPDVERELAYMEQSANEDAFMKKVLTWYTEKLLPEYKKVWQRVNGDAPKRSGRKPRKRKAANVLWNKFLKSKQQMSVSELSKLRDGLVSEEDYTKAAKVRDEINSRGEGGDTLHNIGTKKSWRLRQLFSFIYNIYNSILYLHNTIYNSRTNVLISIQKASGGRVHVLMETSSSRREW